MSRSKNEPCWKPPRYFNTLIKGLMLVIGWGAGRISAESMIFVWASYLLAAVTLIEGSWAAVPRFGTGMLLGHAVGATILWAGDSGSWDWYVYCFQFGLGACVGSLWANAKLLKTMSAGYPWSPQMRRACFYLSILLLSGLVALYCEFLISAKEDVGELIALAFVVLAGTLLLFTSELEAVQPSDAL